MGHIIKEKRKEVTVDMIIKEVSLRFSIRNLRHKIRSSSQIDHSASADCHVSTRKLTNASLVGIGEKFGGKNHATVIHSIKKIEEEMALKKDLKSIIDDLENKIKLT